MHASSVSIGTGDVPRNPEPGNGRIYADHAATTPLRPEVLIAMGPYLGMRACNANSLHAEGRQARTALDAARSTVARLLGARPREIVFTASGTEADNLAVLGGARARRGAGTHIVTAATEHPAVLRAVAQLADEGFTVSVLPVDADGRLPPERFAAALRADTVLASIMLANNEVGTLQPISHLAALARQRGITFHTDAVAAAGRVPLDVDDLGVDLLSLSAHKFYGPQGSGLLYVRTGTPLTPLVVGGGQEGGLRSGTQNLAGAVGLSAALELAVAEQPVQRVRLSDLRDRFEATLEARIPACRINAAAAPRLANVSNVGFADVDATELLVALDLAGAAVSAGSACASGAGKPSHVLAALGDPPWLQTGTLRFSLGKSTSEQDVERLARMVERAVGAARVAHADLGTAHVGSDSSPSEVYS